MPTAISKKDSFSQIASICFYAGVVLETLLIIVDKSAFINPVEGRMFQLTFVLFLIKVLLTRYSTKEYLTILGFGILGIISYYITDRNEILRLVMLIAACKGVDMKKCLKMVFAITTAGCALIIILSLTGIFGAMSLTQDFGRGGVETRYTLGMGHPNALQCMVWALTTLGLYLYGEKMKYYGYALIVVVNLFFFLLTDSKTSLLVILVIIFLSFLSNTRHSTKIRKIGATAGIILTTASIGISLILACLVSKLHDYYWLGDRSLTARILEKMNGIFNGRLYILVETKGYQGAVQSWSLFSRPENNYFFDMGWIRLFYWFGIIPGCIFVTATVILLIYCYRHEQYSAIAMIASFAFYSVMEAHAFSDYLGRNYIFFLMGFYWTGCLQMLTRRREKKQVED